MQKNKDVLNLQPVVVAEVTSNFSDLTITFLQNNALLPFFNSKEWKNEVLFFEKKYSFNHYSATIVHDSFGLSYYFLYLKRLKKRVVIGGWRTSDFLEEKIHCKLLLDLLQTIPSRSILRIEKDYPQTIRWAYKNSLESDLLMDILTAIHDDLSHQYTLKELSSKFHTSESSIKKLFMDKIGKTFREYTLNIRVIELEKLLKAGYPPVEISPMLGYQSVSSLYRLMNDHDINQMKIRK